MGMEEKEGKRKKTLVAPCSRALQLWLILHHKKKKDPQIGL